MNRMSQWIGIGVSAWYTWLIYISNTHQGSEAQADLAAWMTVLFAALALNTYRMDPEFLVQIRSKTHMLRAWTDVLVLAQVILWFVTGHWWLAAMRGLSEVVARRNVDGAYQDLVDAEAQANYRAAR
jgi:hypothetical protein